MEYTVNQEREPLVGQSFNLGEIGGGSQVIIFDEMINPTQHHVLTVGDAPKTEHEQLQEMTSDQEQKSVGRRLFESVRHRLPKLNKTSADENSVEDNHTELRCFRLTFQDEANLLNGKFNCEEFVNPEMVIDFVGKLLDSLQLDRTL